MHSLADRRRAGDRRLALSVAHRRRVGLGGPGLYFGLRACVPKPGPGGPPRRGRNLAPACRSVAPWRRWIRFKNQPNHSRQPYCQLLLSDSGQLTIHFLDTLSLYSHTATNVTDLSPPRLPTDASYSREHDGVPPVSESTCPFVPYFCSK